MRCGGGGGGDGGGREGGAVPVAGKAFVAGSGFERGRRGEGHGETHADTLNRDACRLPAKLIAWPLVAERSDKIR